MADDLVSRLREASNENYNSTAELFKLLGEAGREIERWRRWERETLQPREAEAERLLKLWLDFYGDVDKAVPDPSDATRAFLHRQFAGGG